MKNKYLVLNWFSKMALVLFTGLAFAQDESDVEELDPLISDPTKQPFVRVMANPEKYKDNIVTVSGYYLKGTHLNNLFLDNDSCLSMDSVNSMALDKELDDEGYKPCERTSVKGKLNYSVGSRGWRNETDLELLNTVFPDYIVN